MSAFDFIATVLLLFTGFIAVRSQNAVHAALGLAANFVVLGTVYMSLDARFLGWVQIIVYAGAIMVLFIFVVMLLFAARAEVGVDPLPWLKSWGAAVAAVLFAVLTYALSAARAPLSGTTAAALLEGGTAKAVGSVLWGTWLYAVLLVAALLLVATVAAVVLVHPDQGQSRAEREASRGGKA